MPGDLLQAIQPRIERENREPSWGSNEAPMKIANSTKFPSDPGIGGPEIATAASGSHLQGVRKLSPRNPLGSVPGTSNKTGPRAPLEAGPQSTLQRPATLQGHVLRHCISTTRSSGIRGPACQQWPRPVLNCPVNPSWDWARLGVCAFGKGPIGRPGFHRHRARRPGSGPWRRLGRRRR